MILTMTVLTELLSVVKDAALCILIAVTMDRIEQGDKYRWARLVFMILLFTW